MPAAPTSGFNRILAWLRTGAEGFVALLLASMFASFLVQIVFRYVLNLPLGWTIEYVTMAWLWGVLFGYAFVVRDIDVIRLDLVYNLVPPIARRAMDVIAGLVCAGILGWSLPKAIEYVRFMGIEKTAYMQLPFDLLFSIYIPFVVAVIVRSLIDVWNALAGRGAHAGPEALLQSDRPG